MKNSYSRSSWRVRVLVCVFCWPALVFAQEEKELAPVSGTYAITNVNIIQAPGRKIDMATVIVKDGLIQSVGKNVTIPPDAIIVKADSMYVYAGFIDGFSHIGVIKPKEEQSRERLPDPGNPPPEKAGITPQQDVRNILNPEDKSIEDFRNIGFTTAHVVPHGVLLPGKGAIIQLAGKSVDKMVLASNVSLFSELSWTPRSYPSTVIGVMAKWRELYRQAAQAKNYETLYASNRAGLERPRPDRILEAFYPVIDKRQPVFFKAERILDAQRVLTLQSDLGFPLMVGDLREGWDIVNKLKAANVKVFLTLDLPEKKEDKKDDKKEGEKKEGEKKEGEKKEEPKKDKPDSAEKQALEKRKAEFIAKYESQASVFQKAGVKFGFATESAKAKDVQANIRRMITAGLSEDAALAALTTNPADLLGLSDRLGTVDNGKIANLVISDKPYFNEKAKVKYVFVDGVMHKLEAKEAPKGDPNAKVVLAGSWSFTAETPQGKSESKVVFKNDGNGYTGTVSGARLPQPVDISSVELNGNALKFVYSVTFGTNTLEVIVEGTIEGDAFKGNMGVGQYGNFPAEGNKDPNH